MRNLIAMIVVMCAAPAFAEWKNIPLIEDGKVAKDWQSIGFGKMVVDNGALKTECDPRSMGLLVYTKEPLGNCQIKVVYKPEKPRSNAGVYIRIEDGILKWVGKTATPVQRDANGKLPPAELEKLKKIADSEEGVWYAVHHGFEVQIADGADEMHRTGAIYSLAKADTLPPAKDDGWRTMIITLKGTTVSVEIDGKAVSSFDSAAKDIPPQKNWTEPKREYKRPEAGYIGLQSHDPGDVVWFKEVAVRPLEK
jgi:hypothetical protein